MVDDSKAIGYVRVTSASDYKMAVQRQDINDYCHRKGLDVHAIYEDVGAADLSDREGLSDALNAIRNGDASVLVTSKVSRISRKISDVLAVVKILEDNNASYIAVKDGIDTSTDEGKYFLHVGALFSKMEE